MPGRRRSTAGALEWLLVEDYRFFQWFLFCIHLHSRRPAVIPLMFQPRSNDTQYVAAAADPASGVHSTLKTRECIRRTDC